MQIIRLKEMGLPKTLKMAQKALKEGGIILYPTDTLYGLGVDATKSEAVRALKELKGRETKKPISVIVPDIEAMEACGSLTPEARALAEHYLPGPLTLVLKAHDSMPEDVMLHGNIGVRIPNDEFCLALSSAYKNPITSTSANASGMPSLATIEEILSQLGPKVSRISLVIDDGPRAGGTPSTVVSFANGAPQVLREGAISRTDLKL